MTNVKLLGGALVGAAMAVSGCAGNGSTAGAAQLDSEVSTVSSAIDGRTDLFVDTMLSQHLLTADEVNGSPTATPVEVQVNGDLLVAWRVQPGVAAHTEADIVGLYRIVGTVELGSPDLGTAVAIDNETHPGDPGQIILPGSVVGGLAGQHGTGSVGTRPGLQRIPSPVGLTIDWTNVNGIPNAVDVNTYHNLVNAHPGCA